MPKVTDGYDFRRRTVVDTQGEKIGKVDELYHDERGGQPGWALVNTGLFGTKRTFMPIKVASPTGEDVQVALRTFAETSCSSSSVSFPGADRGRRRASGLGRIVTEKRDRRKES
jgi:hypothetical protein